MPRLVVPRPYPARRIGGALACAVLAAPATAFAADGARIVEGGLLAFGAFGGLLGLTLLYREARRLRRSEARQAEDAAALRVAYAELDAAKRHAEVQAAESQATLTGMTDGLMVLDTELRLSHWNDRFAEITGVPRALLRVGTTMEDILRGQAEAGEFGPMPTARAVEAEVDRRLAALHNFPVLGVVERRRPDGRTFELRRSRLADGRLVTLYTDITARKQVEEAEQRARAAAEAAIDQKRHLVAMVSHEIRVPLDALLGSLALLEPTALVPSQTVLLETARRAGTALRDLVSDILDLSGLDDGQVALRPELFDPRAALADVVEMFRAAAAARSLAIVLDIDRAVPPRIHADAKRLRQVVMNLVSNAAKFAGPGAITIRAEGAPEGLRLEVTDPGPVIPAIQAERLFQPFTRLDSAAAAAAPGSGLGLAISARLVALMGGQIGFCPTESGNRFWFTVAVDAAPGRGPAATLTKARVARRPVRRASILLVEDVAANRMLTASLLRREGHRVDLADTGLVALRLAETHPYDLVLMDIHMPGIDGIETARRLRALPGPAGRTPIVALTGAGSTVARVGGPIDLVLRKPVMPDALEAALRQFVGPTDMPTATAATGLDGLLDAARILALRSELASGQFARLAEQCLADIAARLAELAAEQTRATVAHTIAGMAGSYGLVAIERRMRAIMGCPDGDPAAATLAAGAEAEFVASAAAIRTLLADAAA